MPVSSVFRNGMTLSSTVRTAAVLDHIEELVGLLVDALQMAVGRDDVQPVGITADQSGGHIRARTKNWQHPKARKTPRGCLLPVQLTWEGGTLDLR